ncbi:uncharacterized protein [Miscanthus floridulus]|uniref:uncharacterized protein n=1 Tax=Miscanthus floridulus TaxID=154761 RepID=UPI00345777C9
MALNTIYNAIDSKVFEQIKDCEKASEVWKRLEETYECTPVVENAKLYILKDKLTSFKMKDDESILEMFHRLQVIVNDLKALEEKINNDVSHCDNDEDETKKQKKKKEKKMTFQKKKKGGSYVVTWDSDASSKDDDSSDDDKKSKKKALASIAINNKPSIFDTLSTCLMEKPTKVKYDDSHDDACESDDCRSDDDDEEEDSKEALMDMLENAHTCLEMKRKECKELRKELKALKRSFDEFNASHESLREDHEELGNAHTKHERVHSSLLEKVKEGAKK